jgi:hypothetical protein
MLSRSFKNILCPPTLQSAIEIKRILGWFELSIACLIRDIGRITMHLTAECGVAGRLNLPRHWPVCCTVSATGALPATVIC